MKQINSWIQKILFPFRHKCPICHANWSHQLHGFHQYLQAKTPLKKTIWVFTIFYFLLFAIHYSVFLLNDYVYRRVITLNTIHQVKRLYFPNITICPKYVDSLNFTAIEQMYIYACQT
uniref:Uncharacterized protein n=1 Tax=Meloidogyne enterolobii TaxID=390850 RepID=A0A6V7TV16_MELEN|nr:unnamed protein product [Meloidogyne enterolobii]